ncbi:hypothetical protein JCM3770_003755 [Rhodotorula araucariae]
MSRQPSFAPGAAYTALPAAPDTPPAARRRSRSPRSVLAALAHSHRRALVLVGLLALVLAGGAALHPRGARPRPGAAEANEAEEGWRPAHVGDGAARQGTAAQVPDTRAKWYPAPGAGSPRPGDADDVDASDISFAEADAALRDADGDVDAPPETDSVEDEAGLSHGRGKGQGEGTGRGKSARPFGKAEAKADKGEPADGSSGAHYRPSAEDVDVEEAGTARGDADDADLLADQPGVAAQSDAAAHAPMAAVAPAHKGAPAGHAEGGRGGQAAADAGAEGAGHAAAKAEFARPPPPRPPPAVPPADAADRDGALDDSFPVGAPRPKIGMGGRLGSGAAPVLKPANRVGAGAAAGAVVKEEAGRRVGTGARPGAKGMGARRRRH